MNHASAHQQVNSTDKLVYNTDKEGVSMFKIAIRGGQ